MKKESLYWAFLLVAGLALGACGGDDAEDTQTPSSPSTPSSPAGKWSVTVNAGVNETRGLSLANDKLSANWKTTESVYVYYGDVKVGVLHPTANSDNGSVTLKGDLDTKNYIVGANLTLKFPREPIIYTGQKGTIDDIAENFDYLEAEATILAVDAAAHSMTIDDATFVSKQTIARLTFNQTLNAADEVTITGASEAVSVTLEDAVAVGNPVFVALPLINTATNYTLDISVTRNNITVYEGTLDDKTLQNKKYYTTSVTLQAPLNLSNVTAEHVGMVIGANGKVYTNATKASNAGTTAVALIAYVGTNGSVDASSNTYRGLAIAMKNCRERWCLWYEASCTFYDNQKTNVEDAIALKNGISMTDTLVSKDGHTHAAAVAANSYNVSLPSNTSAWFLPSMGQWNLIIKGLLTKKNGSSYTTDITKFRNNDMEATNLNSVLTTAGATELESQAYWSCSECTLQDVWYVAFYCGAAFNAAKAGDYWVRPVFAF